VKRMLTELFLAPLRAYRRWISPLFPRRCKYYPTCSQYAEQAIRELGIVRGTIVGGWRLLRCNPLSHGGYDPLEARSLFNPGGREAVDRADDPAPPAAGDAANPSTREIHA
jgi:uncharacterized protein